MNTINQDISEAFSKGNFEFAFPHFAGDIEWHVVGASVIKGKEAVISYCEKMAEEMTGSVLTTTKHIIGEHAIATEGYCDYINEGKPGRVEFCDIYSFEGEKLKEITSYVVEVKLN